MKSERIETVYNYDEWCRLVERHGKKMLKKYICRKILVYALCYAVAYQIRF